MPERHAMPSGHQGDRWKIVPGCTCLWKCGQPGQMGWDMLADDVNCPAHHPADAIVNIAGTERSERA